MSPRSLGSSALLHGLLIVLVIFGLPMLPPDEMLYQPQVIAVDLQLAPVANAPTRRPTPPKKPKPEPPKPAPPKVEPEPVKKPEPPKPKPPEPKPEPKPEPVKEKPKPKEPEKKPEKKKEEPKKEPEEKEPTLEDILNSVEKTAPVKEVEEAPAEKGESITSDVPYDPNMPLSQTVRDSIRNQIMKCWNYQGGAKDQGSLVAHIQVVFREDGSILDARLRPSDAMRYNSDSAFRSLVDSARRATKNANCVPLKGLPVDSYPSWSKVELVFDPDEMW